MKMKKTVFTALIVAAMSLFPQKNNAQISKISNKQAMVKALEWQEAHPIYSWAPTDWTNGAYYTGVAQAHKATGDQVYLAALKTMGWDNQWKPFKRTYHADDIAISYAYLYLNDRQKHLVDLDPTKNFLNKHLFEANRWKEGHNAGKSILWWWCDALFMAPPVIVKYAKISKDGEKYLDAMNKYYQQTYDLLYDKKEHLFARDVNYQWKGTAKDLKEENGKKIFWSRGDGWVMAGLALMLQDMPQEYKHRDFYVDLYKEMAARIKELQPADGLWRVSLLDPERFDHGEVSGSGLYTFALAWGVNHGLLNKGEYAPAVKRAWKALRGCQQEDGKIGWVQNIGASPAPASSDSWQNFGTGAFLLAGSQVIQMK